jgi:hypothetical protein
MRVDVALVSAFGISAVGLLFSTPSGQAAFLPGSGMTPHSFITRVQEEYPAMPQTTSKARCRCYPGYPQPKLVCRYPGGRTTAQYVHPRHCR